MTEKSVIPCCNKKLFSQLPDMLSDPPTIRFIGNLGSVPVGKAVGP